MVELFSTDRHNQCVNRPDGSSKCNNPGFSVYNGSSGPFYRCRKCTMQLLKSGNDFSLNGEQLVL